MSEQIDQTGFDIRAAQERVNEFFRNAAAEREAYSKRVRDNARIVPLLMRVATVWEKYPDMRLGQLLMNACAMGRDLPTLGTRMQLIEDDRLLELLESFARTYPPVMAIVDGTESHAPVAKPGDAHSSSLCSGNTE